MTYNFSKIVIMCYLRAEFALNIFFVFVVLVVCYVIPIVIVIIIVKAIVIAKEHEQSNLCPISPILRAQSFLH